MLLFFHKINVPLQNISHNFCDEGISDATLNPVSIKHSLKLLAMNF